MTNVPQTIRDMWTDLYKVFDKHYKLKNTEADWNSFWKDAFAIAEKYGKPEKLVSAIFLVGEVIEERVKAEIKAQEDKADQIRMEGV